MSSQHRQVDLIKEILKILDKTVTDLCVLIKEIKSTDDNNQAYKISIKGNDADSSERPAKPNRTSKY